MQLSKKQLKDRLRQAQASLDTAARRVSATPLRQGYHFMAPAYWINDPNGLIYYRGQYHLFYQFHPYSSSWGAMHWGHAVSDDLVHWIHQPIALAPSESYDDHQRGGCFSGSAVEKDGDLYVFYTGTTSKDGERFDQVQCMAVSRDGGVTFEKYTGNPVIPHPPECGSEHFRDPKVWKRGDYWYMVVGTCKDNMGKAVLYRSLDLEHWEFFNVLAESRGEYGYMWECPDFFELGGRHVLLVSPMGLGERTTVYMVGDMDYDTGKFSPAVTGEVDWGFDFYAPQSFLDGKGRRIIIGWANSWDWMPWWKDFGPVQKDDWCGAYGVPREVRLEWDGTLSFHPVEELETLRQGGEPLRMLECPVGKTKLPCGNGVQYELSLYIDMDRTTAESFSLHFRSGKEHSTVYTFHRKSGEVVLDRTHADSHGSGGIKGAVLRKTKGVLNIRAFVDTISVELFCDDCRTVLSTNVFPTPGDRELYLESVGGNTTINWYCAWDLRLNSEYGKEGNHE